jgi:hypothetical protein
MRRLMLIQQLETEKLKTERAVLKDSMSRRTLLSMTFNNQSCAFLDEEASVAAGARDGGVQKWRCLLKDAVSWQ